LALTQEVSQATPGEENGKGTPPERPPVDAGLTGRSLLIAVVLTVLAGLWIREAEIVVLATQISESIPAIPGLAALVLLLPVNAVLRRFRLFRRIRPLSRGELLVIFLFVTIGSTVMGVGVQRFLLSLLGTPFYFSLPGVKEHLPAWLMPQDPEVMRQLYERAPDGKVPWAHWLGPIAIWTGFFLALWWTLYCMMALFYRSWAEEERLSFPLVFLPMEMTGGESGKSGFFRNRLMWTGFGLAAFYNLVNILYALNPSFPAFGKFVDLSGAFPDPPWSAMTPLMFHFRPEMIGLGYLVSTEISLTVWVSFLLMRLAAVAGVSMGYPPGLLPYPEPQGIGGYLMLALFTVWLSRRHLLRAWRSAITGRSSPGPEGVSYRWAFIGLFVGFAALWAFITAAGMAGWVAFVYLTIVFAVALVYGRLRGEAGVPLVWLFPYYMQKKVLLYTFGSHPFLATGQSTLPAWALFTFLARGYFPAVTGYQVEGMEIARRAGINPRRVAFALGLAVVIGLAVGWYCHLTPYYQHGAQHLRGGIWGTPIALAEYRAAIQYQVTPALPEEPRIWAAGVGAVVSLVLSLLRLRFAAFPLHPLGYVMTCSYGSLIWASFFLVWLFKSLALKYGGMAFYRRTIPLFLGFALGHFAIAGILWGLTGAWLGDAVKGYAVFFG
jgi:uncharacterized protein DUF6785/uncharacterized protein DUF6784